MIFGKYNFINSFLNNAILPANKGSTLRGAFGHAFKNTVCAIRNMTCDKCLLVQKCIYIKVFEPALVKNCLSDVKQMNSPPSPFILEPPLETKTTFSKDDSFEFNLLLFGDINYNFPYFLYAVDQMGKNGVGKRIDGNRGQFRLKYVKFQNDILYSSKTQLCNSIKDIDHLTLDFPITNYVDEKYRLKIEIVTPLRYKIDNKVSSELTFENLIRIMLRRISFLLSYYGSENPKLDYSGIIKKSKQVNILENNFQWLNWRRYSSRQDRKMKFGGLVGSVIYEGSIREFLPYVNFCSKVHIGKQTSFGMGKFNWEIL